MIETINLTKKFRDRTAVDNLSLSIGEGEIFGLLGPNGAGKTTTVKILTTLLKPTLGFARVVGFDVVKDPMEVKKRIGYSPQEINLDRDLSGYQNLFLHGLLHRMENIKERCNELIKWADIENFSKESVRNYSGGMQRRLQIARAIMHNPKVLFLDEPTVGLDPQIRRAIWELILSLKSKRIGVLLTTHYIEEAEMLCDRVGIMNKGKLIAYGTPTELKKIVKPYVVECQDNGAIEYKHFTNKEEAYLFAKDKQKKLMRILEATLEDVFIHYTGERISK
ncbi:MAG: ATP-binding cassette domain-containing protein [Chitinispirillaceae bacterium]|nr:ATP-binding cassette domain-containing protein [Chitinispirillaceae bacterium]